MSPRSLQLFALGLLLAALTSVGVRAVGTGDPSRQIGILSTGDAWSELAPCG